MEKKSVLFIEAKILFFCLALSSCKHTSKMDYQNISRNSSPTFFIAGSKLFKAGKLISARTQFEKFYYGDKYFIPSLLEVQKINYSKEDWERFFGVATYYRTRFLVSEYISKEHFEEKFLTLEILALVRHCRFKEAHKILEWGLQLAQNTKNRSAKMRKTKYFLDLKKTVGDKKKYDRGKKWEEKMYLWPIKPKLLRKLDSPKNVRVKVESQC